MTSLGHHVVAIEHAGDLFVGGAFAEFGMAHEIPRTGGNKSERDGGLRVVREEEIAGELFLDEAGIRLVLVEEPDHVIAIRP